MSASRYQLSSAPYLSQPSDKPARSRYPTARRGARAHSGNGANNAKPRRSNYAHRADRLPLQYVTSVSDCAAAVQKLSSCKQVAVDCEGVALSRTGRLCLLQIASPHNIYVFDLVSRDAAHPNLMFDQGGLRRLLENRNICKVMHDCRHDSDALYHQFAVKLGPVIDTQVVFGVLRKVRGMPEGLPVSLKTLLKKFTPVTEHDLTMKNTIKTSMKGDDDFWSRRPLSQNALQYARLDVEHLLSITSLLSKYIHSADSTAWPTVLHQSQYYLTVFRDDHDGPRKAQQQYEQMARVARRERAAVDAARRAEKLYAADPLRSFTFDRSLVIQAMQR